MSDGSHWEAAIRFMLEHACELIQQMLERFRDKLDTWLNGLLAGPIPENWREELARFVEETRGQPRNRTGRNRRPGGRYSEPHRTQRSPAGTRGGDVPCCRTTTFRQRTGIVLAAISLEHNDYNSAKPGTTNGSSPSRGQLISGKTALAPPSKERAKSEQTANSTASFPDLYDEHQRTGGRMTLCNFRRPAIITIHH